MGRWLAILLLVLAGCTPQVIPAGPVTTVPVVTTDALVMADGARLPLYRWLPAGPPKAVILGLHGMNDAAFVFFEDAAPLLNAAGIALYAYDQRGFGAAPHPGIWAGGATLATEASEAARLIRARHPGVPLYLLGESMGGAVALVAAGSAAPPPVDGYILLAPALWGRESMPGFMRGWLWLAARTMPIVGFRGTAGGLRATDNDAAMLRWARDPRTLKETRVDAAYGLVNLMDAAVAAVPGCCQGDNGPVPVLVLLGEQDRIVPLRIVRRVLRQLPAPAEAVVAFYPAGFHLLLRDSNRDVVARDIAAWMAAPGAALPSGADRAGAAWMAQ
jgi:alpha-beta hydrolase superfamily lysophospholipase